MPGDDEYINDWSDAMLTLNALDSSTMHEEVASLRSDVTSLNLKLDLLLKAANISAGGEATEAEQVHVIEKKPDIQNVVVIQY